MAQILRLMLDGKELPSFIRVESLLHEGNLQIMQTGNDSYHGGRTVSQSNKLAVSLPVPKMVFSRALTCSFIPLEGGMYIEYGRFAPLNVWWDTTGLDEDWMPFLYPRSFFEGKLRGFGRRVEIPALPEAASSYWYVQLPSQVFFHFEKHWRAEVMPG